jgi:sensor histidine kinase regulating citrate/malate metabolism
MAMLTALIQYEAELNNHGSMGLALLTLGLLAINIILLGLHGRLAIRAAELQEKQRMLEQSEIQNRYFQETLAANNNMRGFRHDLKNHLQVLSCLLGMNRHERAREYLQEIGDFVDRNDFNMNSGVPLVDAVLGNKIAMAKRLGIDICHTVLLEEDLPIEALDLCSLLGNMLDNALEACQKIADGSERRVELTLLAQAGKLELTVRNTVPSGCSSSLKSTKQEEGHGLGLSIVQQTVKKYNGEIKINCGAGEFSVRIYLSADTVPKSPARKKRALPLYRENSERPIEKPR